MAPDPEDQPSEPEAGVDPVSESAPGPDPLSLPNCRKCGAKAKFNPNETIECDNCGIVAE